IDGTTSENSIVGFGTGVLANGTVTVTGNDASIHGNTIGIDVNGGSATATISSNHIYDNGTGVSFTGGGTGSVTGNNFDGGASNDNGTDLYIGNAGVTIGTGNAFAGDTFFINNQSATNYDLTANSTTFEGLNPSTLADNFRIEDKIHHRVDTDLLVTNGLVTWVTGNLYVTTPGVGSSDSSIQRGIDASSNGNTVNVEAGDYDQIATISKSI